MTPAGFYFDPQTLTGLKQTGDQQQTLERVAYQFEALFMHMLLKQMREASFGEGLFESDQSKFYRDMFDAQLAQHVGGNAGLGIARLLVQQLGEAATAKLPETSVAASAVGPRGAAGSIPATDVDMPPRGTVPASDDLPTPPAPAQSMIPAEARAEARRAAHVQAAVAAAAQAVAQQQEQGAPEPVDDWQSPQQFLSQLQPFARQVEKALGVPSEVLLAQATLETGWGQKLPRLPDGRNSFNLFGIKADARWPGARVTQQTLEFSGGAMQQERAQFRAYASPHESFQDYAQFLQSNPRYADALSVADDPAAYLHALQDAGYATDPQYAHKILGLVHSERFRNALPGSNG